MDVRYRLRQLRRNLTAGPLPAEAVAEIRGILSADEMALFDRFSETDRSHSYRVMRMLREAGDDEPALLKAALLHDIGKTTTTLTAWDRTVAVVGQKLWSARAAQWGAGEPVGWRRPFVVRFQHPAWGAAMAQAAGSAPQVVSLIRRHQDPAPNPAETEEDALLIRLQWADDQN